jgi:hypothetical protein
MTALRRALYVQAAVWAALGAVLLLAPGVVLRGLFDRTASPGDAWLRLLGLAFLGLAMVMVLVGHRVEDVWWWSWAFAFVTVGMAVVLVLHAAFGLAPGESGGLWWLAAAVTTGLALHLLYGLFAASREQPLP